MKQKENTKNQRRFARNHPNKSPSHTKKGPGRKHQQGKS